MKKKMLCLAVLGALGVAQAVMAQEFDDRWYLSGAIGENLQDHFRSTEDAPLGMIGIGKFVAPNWSVDLEFNYQDPKNNDKSGHWTQYGGTIAGRYHFMKDGRNWWPYLKLGVGAQHVKEDFRPVLGGSVFTRSDTHFATELGFGLQANYGRVDVRGEVGVRYDFDDSSVHGASENNFRDFLASVGVTVALGPEPMKAVEPAPAPPPAPVVTCADKDSDGDGVNDCNDKCPNTQAGTTVGPDGCPVPVTIDLRGVNFDFDKSKLRPDAVEILNQAIEVLKRHPELRVEVAGHTDLCGTDAYNQKLSEKRAKVVYDYLTSNGVDAGRLVGPNGYGETHPLEQTPQTYPPCKSEKNRRTELNVQN